MAYATLADYTSTFAGVDDNLDDGRIPTVLDVASAEVDEWCQRSFTVSSGTSAKVYQRARTGLVLVDDFSTTTGLVVSDNGTALTVGTDFYVDRPTISAHPYYRLRFSPTRWPEPGWEPLLSVTADWGWAAVPAQVKRATLLLAHDLMRPMAHGIIGLDVGVAFRVGQNREVAALLSSFRRGDRTAL